MAKVHLQGEVEVEVLLQVVPVEEAEGEAEVLLQAVLVVEVEVEEGLLQAVLAVLAEEACARQWGVIVMLVVLLLFL